MSDRIANDIGYRLLQQRHISLAGTAILDLGLETLLPVLCGSLPLPAALPHKLAQIHIRERQAEVTPGHTGGRKNFLHQQLHIIDCPQRLPEMCVTIFVLAYLIDHPFQLALQNGNRRFQLMRNCPEEVYPQFFLPPLLLNIGLQFFICRRQFF